MVLEQHEEKLDIKRYAEAFFELFICGALVLPGGVIGEAVNPFCIFAADCEVGDIKARMAIIEKMARRYKYIPAKLEEALSHLLQYSNKFNEDIPKLAMAVALSVTSGLVSASVLHQLLKDHLVRDGSSLSFFTLFAQTALTQVNADQLTTILRKNGLGDNLDKFFPPDDRGEEIIKLHFESSGLKVVHSYYLKQKSLAQKSDFALSLLDVVSTSSPAEVLVYITQQMANSSIVYEDIVPSLWNGICDTVDWGKGEQQFEGNIVKLMEVTSY